MDKIMLWKSRLLSPFPNYSSFPLLNDTIDSSDHQNENLKSVIIEHLWTLNDELKRYFRKFKKRILAKKFSSKSIYDNIILCISDIPDKIQEELIELKCNSYAKQDFEPMEADAFWLKYYKVYPLIGTEALTLLIQFSSTCVCVFYA